MMEKKMFSKMLIVAAAAFAGGIYMANEQPELVEQFMDLASEHGGPAIAYVIDQIHEATARSY